MLMSWNIIKEVIKEYFISEMHCWVDQHNDAYVMSEQIETKPVNVIECELNKIKQIKQ